MSAPFPLPMVFAAWGFRNGAAAYGNAGGLGDLCKAQGIKTVAVQLGNKEYAIHKRFHQRKPKDGQPWTTRQDAEWLRERGIRVVVWGVATGAFALSELQRLGCTEDDWVPQIEGPSQADYVLDASAHGLRAPAIVTNYSGAGDTPGEADELRRAGVRTLLVECYNDAGIIEPYTDLARMLWQGQMYGWGSDELVPTMGTYHGETPADYSGTAEIGRNFGLYLAEPMSAAQWEAFGALNPDAPTPPTPEDDDVQPITDQQARESVKTVTQAAVSAYESPKPKGRNTVAWRIANADDDSWNAARDEVVNALNAAGVPDVPD